LSNESIYRLNESIYRLSVVPVQAIANRPTRKSQIINHRTLSYQPICQTLTMPKRGKKRKKTRTHTEDGEGALTSAEESKIPKSLVVRNKIGFSFSSPRFICTQGFCSLLLDSSWKM
jgi:hypothetical protein